MFMKRQEHQGIFQKENFTTESKLKVKNNEA